MIRTHRNKPFGRGPTNNAETQPMKIRFVEILSFILILLTIAAGVLTLPEIQVLPEAWLKFVPFVLGSVLAFKNGIYIYLDWLDDGLINKSYNPPPKLGLIVAACLCLGLVSCAGFDWQAAAKRAAIITAQMAIAKAEAAIVEEQAKPSPDVSKLLALQLAIQEANRVILEAKGQPVPHDILPLPEGTGGKEVILVSPHTT